MKGTGSLRPVLSG